MVETHPVKIPRIQGLARICPQVVTRAAYEVYCHVYGPQEALVTGGCRGGFSAGELIALLYAKTFPRSEWKNRVNEALKGMQNL